MAHEVENMMYVGETPWHGLGVRMPAPPATVLEALREGGLDWEVELQQLSRPDGQPVQRFASVRKSDGATLGTVGPGYRVLQNSAAFKFFDPYLASGSATIETAGSLRGGARVWMQAKIARPDSVIVAKADDRVAKYLLLAQGHDGSLAVHVGLTPQRVVCQNTLSVAVPAARGKTGQKAKGDVSASGILRIRHTANAGNLLDEVQATIDRADRDFERAAEFFRGLAGKNIRSAARLRAYVEAVFPPRKKGEKGKSLEEALATKPAEVEEGARANITDTITEILEGGGKAGDLKLPGVKGTAWAAYNAVTEYMTWHRGRGADTRMNNVWLSQDLNRRALHAAKAVFLDA